MVVYVSIYLFDFVVILLSVYCMAFFVVGMYRGYRIVKREFPTAFKDFVEYFIWDLSFH